jgi:hypothetical protein
VTGLSGIPKYVHRTCVRVKCREIIADDLSASPVEATVESQPFIPTGERPGLQMHIVTMASVTLHFDKS